MKKKIEENKSKGIKGSNFTIYFKALCFLDAAKGLRFLHKHKVFIFLYFLDFAQRCKA